MINNNILTHIYFSLPDQNDSIHFHFQLQGSVENFMGDCDDVIDWLNMVTHYPLFTEGWALYAENPLLSQETSIYEDHPLQKYGMLKWQIWRALRLIVDTGLHHRGICFISTFFPLRNPDT